MRAERLRKEEGLHTGHWVPPGRGKWMHRDLEALPRAKARMDRFQWAETVVGASAYAAVSIRGR